MSLELKQKLIEMRAKGYSYDKISKELGKAKQTVIDWAKELEDEISNFKAMEIEALYEEFHLLKENRLRNLGDMLRKVRNEIERRDFSNVPTDKLLALYVKLYETARSEIIEPVFKSTDEIDEMRIRGDLFNNFKGSYEPLLIGKAIIGKNRKLNSD